MKMLLYLVILKTFSLTAFSQDKQNIETANQTFSYAFVTIEGKTFSKKIKVEVDFGENPEQVKAGKEYSEILTNKKSHTAILNFMAERHFELVETRDYISLYAGSGGTTGIILISRKKM